MFSGSTDRSGAPSQFAWGEYGWNLDGRVIPSGARQSAKEQLCIPYGGAEWSVHDDGTDGIDNSFGANILPTLDALGFDVEASTNEAIATGSTTLILDLTNLGEVPNDVQILGKLYAGTNRESAPRLDGTDVWPVAPELLSNPNDITSSKVEFADSYVSSGTWVGEMGGEFTLTLSVRSQSFKLVVQRPLIAISVGSSSDEVSSGTIGGIVPVESLLAEVRQAVGHASSALCGSAAFESMADQVREAADSLADGTQDPRRVCDAISVGLGFDAVTVVRPPDHGEIAQQAPPLAWASLRARARGKTGAT